MGKKALTSHAGGKKHFDKEQYRKSTASVAVLFSSQRKSDGTAATPGEAASTTATTPDEAASTASSASASISVPVPSTPTVDTSTSAVGKNRPTERTYFVKDEVTKTEILLCLLAVHRHQSVRDVSSLVDLLPLLFPDSEIASGIKLHKTKVSYGITYGLAPYFKEQLRETLLQCDRFAVGFDESLIK